ncbi:MAG TPA: hypothetical protein VIG32_06335 [Candidatus Baltobacteraceae bacterium]|jgi:hypothetical protein
MYLRPRFIPLLAGALACFFGTPAIAYAQSVPPDTAIIQDSSFTDVLGIVKVNQAAGAGNVQANLAIVSHSPLHVNVTQVTDTSGASGDVEIIGFAFSNTAGILQINQAAGNGNAHANVTILEYDLSAAQMTDTSLQGVVPTQHVISKTTPSTGLGDRVRVGPTTFAGSSGIVQVNQTAGSANTATNSFLLQVQQGSIGP